MGDATLIPHRQSMRQSAEAGYLTALIKHKSLFILQRLQERAGKRGIKQKTWNSSNPPGMLPFSGIKKKANNNVTAFFIASPGKDIKFVFMLL